MEGNSNIENKKDGNIKMVEIVSRIMIGIVIVLLLFSSIGVAIPTEEWNKTFGGVNDDFANSGQQTHDKGYIFGGMTSSSGWLVKTDRDGNEQWSNTLEGSVKSVKQTHDKGYIIAGSGIPPSGGRPNYWIEKVDRDGNLQWSKLFGGDGIDVANIAVQTRDRGYIVAGQAGGSLAGIYDAWVVKTDDMGNELWNKSLGRGIIYSIQPIPEGYIFAGRTLSGNPTSTIRYAWVIKTDIDGNEVWNKTYGIGAEEARSIIRGKNGYIFAGSTESYGSGGSDAWIVKIDYNGVEQWNKAFGGTDWDNAYSISLDKKDGKGYVFAGRKYSPTNNYDAWIVKIDNNGVEQWSKTFGGINDDETYVVQQTSDKGYVLIGKTSSYGAGGSDAWIIKIKK